MKTRNILLALTLAVIFYCTAAFSQTVPPSPAATPPTDEPVVKITTNLIQLDVVVTDKNGNVVGDLKPEDFEVSENGTKRTISGFSFISPKQEIANGDITSVLTASNSAKINNRTLNVNAVGRIIAIVVDDMRMSAQEIAKNRPALEKLIRSELQDNDLVAIIKTSGSTGVQQSFTNDKEKLLNDVAQLSYQPLTSAGLGSLAPLSVSFGQQAASMIAGVGLLSNSASTLNDNKLDVESINQSFRNTGIMAGTLQNLQRTIDAMGTLKGRKLLLLISPGMNLRSDTTGTGGAFGGMGGGGKSSNADGNEKTRSMSNQLDLSASRSITLGGKDYSISNLAKFITEIANRNSVTIFASDPRGSTITNLSAADDAGAFAENRNTGNVDAGVRGRNLQVQYEQEMLRNLADDTGGRAFINTNDLGASFKAALNSQQGYYLLAYQPDDETFDPNSSRFNKLNVKVKRPNVNVDYRSGFFNVALPDKKTPQTDDAEALQKLLAPYDYSDIGVQIATISAYSDKSASTVRSFVSVPAKSLAQTDASAGKKNAKFDVIITVVDDKGMPLGFFIRNYVVSYDAASSAEFLKSDIISNFGIQIPRSGTYKIRVLIRDSSSKKIGTATQMILVPDLQKEQLALSGLLLQNLTPAQWQTAQTDPAAFSRLVGEKTPRDTALRRFKKGTILSFIYSLYAASELTKNGPLRLLATTRLFKDGTAVLNGPPVEMSLPANQRSTSINRSSAINLATTMTSGRYSLQMEISAPSVQKTETQTIGFEIID